MSDLSVSNKEIHLSKGKGAVPWKGTIGKAVAGSSVKTDLLKLARLVYKAADDNEPDTLVTAWMKKAEETVAWAVSDAAGDTRLAKVEDIPPGWVAAVQEVSEAFRVGCDMTKIPSYHQMKKVMHMLKKNLGEDPGEEPVVPDSERDKLMQEVEAAEILLAEAKERSEAAATAEAANDEATEDEDDSDDVEIVEDEDGEGEVEAEPVKPDHVEEPEKGKDKTPGKSGVDDDVKKISDDDAVFVASVIEAALKSGQVLDPDKISLTPVYLLQIVKMLEELTEGKRNQLVKGINTLVLTQYENHVKEKAEGAKRTQTQKQKRLAAEAQALAAKKKGHDKVIQLADKKATKTVEKPPTRTKGDAAEFAGKFAALMGTNK